MRHHHWQRIRSVAGCCRFVAVCRRTEHPDHSVVSACVGACVRGCVGACARACACRMCTCVCACLCAWVRGARTYTRTCTHTRTHPHKQKCGAGSRTEVARAVAAAAAAAVSAVGRRLSQCGASPSVGRSDVRRTVVPRERARPGRAPASAAFAEGCGGLTAASLPTAAPCPRHSRATAAPQRRSHCGACSAPRRAVAGRTLAASGIHTRHAMHHGPQAQSTESSAAADVLRAPRHVQHARAHLPP